MFSRELDDPHRLAHVEHEDLAAPADRAGLDDERDRLGDRHEVARHLGVGDRDRPAARDLAAEDRDHAARRSRARCRSGPRRSASATSARCPSASTIHSQSAFDWPITVFGFDGLVGRDEHEALGAELDRASAPASAWRARCCAPPRAGSPPSAARACTRRRGRRPRAVALEDLAHLRARCCTSASTGTHGREAALVDELALDLEEGGLGVVDEDEPLAAWRACDLAAELGADRAAGAGDEHRLAGEVRRRSRRRRPRPARGRARPRPGPAGSGPRGRGRRRSARAGRAASSPGTLARARDLDDALAVLARRGRDRDQELVRPVVAEQMRRGRRSCRARGRRGGGGSSCAGRRRRGRSACSRAPGCAASPCSDQLRRVAGADDDHLLAARDDPPGRRPLDQRAREQPRAGDEREQQQQVDDRRRARQPEPSWTRRA